MTKGGRGDGGGSVPVSRVPRAGGRVGAGAVRAPDCPRTRARRRAQLPFRWLRFSISAGRSLQKGERRPRVPPPSAPILPRTAGNQALFENKKRTLWQISSNLLTPGRNRGGPQTPAPRTAGRPLRQAQSRLLRQARDKLSIRRLAAARARERRAGPGTTPLPSRPAVRRRLPSARRPGNSCVAPLPGHRAASA